jgi:hypothetical protein
MNEFLLTTNKDYNIHSSRKSARTPDANKLASFNKHHQSPKIYRDTKSQPAEIKHSSATIPHHKEPPTSRYTNQQQLYNSAVYKQKYYSIQTLAEIQYNNTFRYRI